jgi:adenylate cyclase, class 2
MAIEIEKKYRVTARQFADLARELADAGAEFFSEEFEVNTIYISDRLAADASIVRIRTTPHRSILTFKKRLENSYDTKQQLEIESEISDPEAVATILSQLDLAPRLLYEKRRKTYRLKEVEVVLDELPFGLFVEVEGDIMAIKEAEMILGMEDLEVEHDTYPRLTARLGKQVEGIIEARFQA